MSSPFPNDCFGRERLRGLLLELLTELDAVAVHAEEIGDTVCRERMGNALFDGFVKNRGPAALVNDYGLFEPSMNGRVGVAIKTYITRACEIADRYGINRFHDRLAALQDGSVVTSETSDYEDFFGHTSPESYDADGNVIWSR